MDSEKFEMQLIDFIDGKLTEAERHEVEQELMRNEKAYKLYEQFKEVMKAMDHAKKLEPSPQMKERFDQLLAAEVATTKKAKVIFLRPAFYRVAAAIALLVIGGGVGFWISRQNSQREEIARIRQEMEATKAMMMSMIENQQSASQRMQGVNVALSIEKADDEVVTALVNTLNNDPNTNVRMAALDALSKFHREPHVRKVLIDALSNQKDPLVQIALIQLMVKMKETGVVDDLKRIVEDDETMEAVKDEAYSGILQLS